MDVLKMMMMMKVCNAIIQFIQGREMKENMKICLEPTNQHYVIINDNLINALLYCKMNFMKMALLIYSGVTLVSFIPFVIIS